MGIFDFFFQKLYVTVYVTVYVQDRFPSVWNQLPGSPFAAKFMEVSFSALAKFEALFSG